MSEDKDKDEEVSAILVLRYSQRLSDAHRQMLGESVNALFSGFGFDDIKFAVFDGCDDAFLITKEKANEKLH